jgi:hypothetical protein
MEQQDLPIKIVVNGWHAAVASADELFNNLTDEQLQHEVSPGRNTGTYLLGHLVAVHDRMLPLLGLGARKYAQLDDAFINSPDKSGKTFPPIAELRTYWKDVKGALATGFNSMQPGDWLQRHTSISEEDFAKEPHRNKLNVLVSRTSHLSSHYGQLLFLKK